MRVTHHRAGLGVDHPLVAAVTTELHRPSRPRGRAVLLTHGAGGDLDQANLVALADAIAVLGHPVVRANQPWRQVGRALPPRAERTLEGFAAVVGAAAAAHGPRRGWIAAGASFGGRVATMAVAAGLVELDGLVCLGYPLHPRGRPDEPRVDHWSDVSTPLLLLQGTADRLGTPDELAPHLPRLSGPTVVHPVPGADHGLTIAAKRAPDGVRRTGPEVAGPLGQVVVDWIDTLDEHPPGAHGSHRRAPV